MSTRTDRSNSAGPAGASSSLDEGTPGFADLVAGERARFMARHPRSAELATQCEPHFLFGVPMHWMRDWPTPVPLFVQEARGAGFRCVDGHDYLDFCLGDTGAMFGHAPAPVARILAEHAARGLTTMLPAESTAALGRSLSARFRLPMWQMCTTASDANRFVLRWARAITGRDTIVVFDGCYHGTVDDTFVDLVDGHPRARASLLGQVHELTRHTRVVEFNDLPALARALADCRVACVLMEPVLTNVGMVLPQPGFLTGVRELTREHGTLLVLDETHTISSGPGGYAVAHRLQPDMLVLGKPIAGGMPGAVYGFTAEVGARMAQAKAEAPAGHSGIGTTLSGNMLTVQLMQAMLADVMTPAAYAQMFEVADRIAAGLRRVVARHRLRAHVTRIGARCELQFSADPPRNGREARAAMRPALEAALHLALLNRGIMLTPFHNMVLCCPEHRAADADRLVDAVDEVLGQWSRAG